MSENRKIRLGSLVRMSIAVVLLVVGYLVLALVATRLSTPPTGAVAIFSPDLPQAGARLSVVTWNLGYAGLGADADFIADGGTSILPKSPEVVRANLAGIASVIARNPSDAVLVQEVSTSSPLNYWTDVEAAIENVLDGYGHAIGPDIQTKLLPPPLSTSHGKATFARTRIESAERLPLSPGDAYILGVLRHNYSALLTRLPIENSARSWIIFNIHLSAFDDGGVLRRMQLFELLALAVREHWGGHPVIIGGDFNLEFVRDAFPATEDDAARFWLVDFPREVLPEGWLLVYATNSPSARTLASAYEAGSTYTTVIDGFIISPGVAVESIRTIDTGFAFSDHQPVIATFALDAKSLNSPLQLDRAGRVAAPRQ